jgi:hypothetical protein
MDMNLGEILFNSVSPAPERRLENQMENLMGIIARFFSSQYAQSFNLLDSKTQ